MSGSYGWKFEGEYTRKNNDVDEGVVCVDWNEGEEFIRLSTDTWEGFYQEVRISPKNAESLIDVLTLVVRHQLKRDRIERNG